MFEGNLPEYCMVLSRGYDDRFEQNSGIFSYNLRLGCSRAASFNRFILEKCKGMYGQIGHVDGHIWLEFDRLEHLSMRPILKLSSFAAR